MIGTTIKIFKVRRKLSRIQKEKISDKQLEGLRTLAKELGVPVPPGLHNEFPLDSINAITLNIHTWLQTEIMMITCFLAAVAAIFACISSLVALVTVLGDC